MKNTLGYTILSLFVLFNTSCSNVVSNSNSSTSGPDSAIPSSLPKTSETDAPTPPEIKGDLVINKTSLPSSVAPISFLNNDGTGIIVWEGNARKLINFQPVGDEYRIGYDFGNGSISLNSKGNGVIVWSSALTASIGAPPPAKFYARRIENYLPVEEQILIRDKDIPITFGSYCIATAKIDENGNGLILWYSTKSFNSIEISNFKILKENVKEIPTKEKIWPYLAFENKKIVIKEMPIGAGIPNIDIDEKGNGSINWQEMSDNNQNKIFLQKIENYLPIGDKNEIGITKSIDLHDIKVDSYGNGIFISKEVEDDSDIFARTISNFKVDNNSIKITDKSSENRAFRVYPKLALNNNGNGLLLWSDFSVKAIYGRLISKFKPMESDPNQQIKTPVIQTPPPIIISN